MAEKRTVGEGYAELIAPDVLAFKWIGTVDIPEASIIMEWSDQIMKEQGRVFVLVDMTEASGVTTAARKHMTNYSNVSGFSLYGTSFQMRVIVNLVINALSLLRSDPQAANFANTRDEALEWIDQERQKLSAQ